MHFQFNPEARVAFESTSCTGYVYTHAASRITCLSMRTMRHYAQTGVIPAIRRGRRCWMFRATDLHNFNEERALGRRLESTLWPQNSLRVL
jgi:hypothetical protein